MTSLVVKKGGKIFKIQIQLTFPDLNDYFPVFQMGFDLELAFYTPKNRMVRNHFSNRP